MAHGLAALALLATLNANAYLYTYQDRAEFEAASQNLNNIDFEGIVAPGTNQAYGATGLDVGDAHFSGSSNYLYVWDDALYPIYFDWDSGATLFGIRGGTITATLNEGVHAVGADFMALVQASTGGYEKAAADFTVTLSSGDTVDVVSEDYPDRAFIGFISEDFEITSISWTSSANAYLSIDNFVTGEQRLAVSSAGALMLMLAGFAAFRRRQGIVAIS